MEIAARISTRLREREELKEQTRVNEGDHVDNDGEQKTLCLLIGMRDFLLESPITRFGSVWFS